MSCAEKRREAEEMAGGGEGMQKHACVRVELYCLYFTLSLLQYQGIYRNFIKQATR